MEQQKIIMHGAAVALKQGAVLIRGFSGRGKSDLAFRLIEGGAQLLGDDQVILERRQDKVMATGSNIQGLLEVRGVGLLKYPVAPPTPLRLIVDLVLREEVPRLPERETLNVLGFPIHCIKLHAFDVSTVLKVIKALELTQKPDLSV